MFYKPSLLYTSNGILTGFKNIKCEHGKKIKGPVSMTICLQVELKIFIKKTTTIYTNIESIMLYTFQTNVMLYVNYTSVENY